MFSSNKELFEFINSLIKKLDSIGETQWSIAFSDAIHISFMPGELLGAIRFTLRKFQKTKIPARLDIEKEISGAIDSLDKALGPNNR